MATRRADPVRDLQEIERVQDERSKPFSAILRDVVGNVQAIIRSEVQLAKTEIKEEAAAAGAAASVGVSGAVLTLFGLAFLFAAGAFGLALVMPAWLACLLMAVVLLATGGALALTGWSRFRAVRLIPPRTAESLKENAEWLRNQAR